ncbi:MAG TPA: substrate-binding domain-containing protein [Terriglobales bacterium]|nr:substrate-binding domain-containing protein [Terriglobales bacterium]
MYLRAQKAAAKAAADRLAVDLQVVSAEMDAVAQGQELLQFVQSRTEPRLDGILLEPVSANGLPRVAEAAVAAGIGWVVSNAQVEYLGALRKKANVPVFLVSQDHVEVGRIQGRQIAALLPDGGSVLYLRGPAMSSIASKRFEGLDSTKPRNVELKSLKVQGSTAEDACKAVRSWLSLSTVRPESTQLIMSQNVDFISGARKALETIASPADRAKWLALPCAGVGISSQVKPLVDQGVLCAAVLTSLTMDRAMEMLVKAIKDGSQPPEQTFVEADQYPTFEELVKRGKRLTSEK